MTNAARFAVTSWCLAALLAPASVRGQDVTARAYLSSAEVGLNGPFALSVEVSGVRRLDADPELPDLSAFATHLGSATSTSVQIVNFRTSVTYTVEHRFVATRAGTFDIGPITVYAGGQTVRTEPLTLTVSATPAPGAATPPPGAGGDAAAIGPDDLFLTAEVSPRRVYENEPAIVTYRMWTVANIASYRVVRLPAATGFWVEELENPGGPRIEHRERNGVRYATAVVRKVALFPTVAGSRSVDPLTIEAQVEVRTRSRDPFSSFFEGPFGRRVPVVVASPPVDIDVRPLPEAGRPAAFSGFVGSLRVSASVDSTQARTNQAITYRVQVRGEGNVRTIPEPRIRFPAELEAFPPEVQESVERGPSGVSGTRTYEYVLLPRAPGTLTIPAVRYAYFDAATSSYRTAEAAAITVEVTGPVVAAGSGAAGGARGSVEQLRQDIRFIRVATPRFTPARGPLVARAGFWIVALLPLLAVGGAVGYRRHRDRVEGDVAYARLRRARRVAAKRLARARALAAPATQREFYAEVARALRGFLGDKLNIAEAGMITDELRPRLRDLVGADDIVDDYFGCLAACDRQRYAPSTAGEREMRELLERAEHAMAGLDRALAR